MPVMNGFAMVENIHRINKDVPIILLSAFNDTNHLLKAIHLGIQHYLFKPINIDKLFTILGSVAKQLSIKENLKQNEQVLAQYKKIVDLNSIVSKADKTGNITYVNDAFVKISGYCREELIGQNHSVIRHPDTPSLVFQDLWKTIALKKEWTGIIKNKAKDGSSYIVDSIIIPILDINNEIIEFISLRKDITQSEIQKEHLKTELHDNSKTLCEKTIFIHEFEKAIKESTIFCRTSVKGAITMTSKEFDRILGYEEDELINLDYRKIIELEKDKKVAMEKESNIKKGTVWQGLVKHNTKDKKTVYLESSFIPIIGTNSEILEVFCFFVDISDSVKLHKEIITTQREVISTMGAIGESRSQETAVHVRRVAEYSKLLALKIGLSEEEAEELKMASPMHDIGKVGIPDSILNKPGKLTINEFEIMKTHSQLGFEMLRHSNQKLLQSAAIVANQHHERWDGSGYPNRLAGQNIHIYGRITAVADVFDALGHDRVYKDAWPLEDILSLMKDSSGTHFDPNLIDIFMNNLDEFIEIKNNFNEEANAYKDYDEN